jgi:CHAD domain-containing protein
MAYHLLRNESVEEGVRRIVSEQIDSAIVEIEDTKLDPHETVHQVRKRCKKIRGAIRLVRQPAFEDTYQFENEWFRDAAGKLAFVRDAEAMREAYDKLLDTFAEQVDHLAFDSIREALMQRRQRVAEDQGHLEEGLSAFLTAMHQARERVASWSIGSAGFAAIDPGLQKTYRRGRKAMVEAYREPSDEQFHEWRKRVKYYRYHNRLLQDLWKPVLTTNWEQVKELSDFLGDDHDLAVFRQTLLANPKEFGSKRDIQAFLGLLDRRRAQLQNQAKTLGEYVFAEKPKQLGWRLCRYWQVWHGEDVQQSSKLAEAAVTHA